MAEKFAIPLFLLLYYTYSLMCKNELRCVVSKGYNIGGMLLQQDYNEK